jgi:hypothetical protein
MYIVHAHGQLPQGAAAGNQQQGSCAHEGSIGHAPVFSLPLAAGVGEVEEAVPREEDPASPDARMRTLLSNLAVCEISAGGTWSEVGHAEAAVLKEGDATDESPSAYALCVYTPVEGPGDVLGAQDVACSSPELMTHCGEATSDGASAHKTRRRGGRASGAAANAAEQCGIGLGLAEPGLEVRSPCVPLHVSPLSLWL